jgi:hypothetical protein
MVSGYANCIWVILGAFDIWYGIVLAMVNMDFGWRIWQAIWSQVSMVGINGMVNGIGDHCLPCTLKLNVEEHGSNVQ